MENIEMFALTDAVIPSQTNDKPCATCGDNATSGERPAPTYVYALGRIELRFPNRSIEKELMQIVARSDTTDMTDSQALHSVLSKRENRYLARSLCYVLTVEGLDTYIVVPHDLADYELLVNAIRPTPGPADIDVIIGMLGRVPAPEHCDGLAIPMVITHQVYSFDRASLVQAIPRPQGLTAKQFGPAAEEMFDRIMQIADNAGATDDHRALNYLAMRYPAIYATTAEAYGRSATLTGVDVRPSRLSGVRKVVDVIFSYTNRQTDVTEKFFTRVDVTEQFPFLVTRMSPYYDR